MLFLKFKTEGYEVVVVPLSQVVVRARYSDLNFEVVWGERVYQAEHRYTQFEKQLTAALFLGGSLVDLVGEHHEKPKPAPKPKKPATSFSEIGHKGSQKVRELIERGRKDLNKDW